MNAEETKKIIEENWPSRDTNPLEWIRSAGLDYPTFVKEVAIGMLWAHASQPDPYYLIALGIALARICEKRKQ